MFNNTFIRTYQKIILSLLAVVILFVISLMVINNMGTKKELKPLPKSVLVNALASLDVLETLNFTEDKSVFINPEKGFYRPYESNDIWEIEKLKSLNISLILVEADIKAFKTGPISDAKLAEIQNAFTLARQNGVKVIFRAAYDLSGVVAPEPADINILLNHIAQLKKIFYDNEDVLYCVQAGFIGSWGEWHSTIYGADPKKYNSVPLDVRKKVVAALLDAVPKTRMIQIREPRYIRDMYANASGGNVLTDATAFNGSDLSRTGFHNDGLFYDESDCGTYDLEPGYDRAKELEWANVQMKYTPFGGESNGLSKYSDPANAVADFEKLHAQYVNIDYYPGVITKWKNTSYNGENTFAYISRKLGYRFLLTGGEISSKVYVGGAMHLKLSIKNDGFGGLMNPRTFEIVLSNGVDTYKAKVNDDPRKWYKENGVMSKDLYFTIPSNIKAGNWNVYLNLPDASDKLKNNPNYSIRLANGGIWNATTGFNLLKSGIVIEDAGLTNTNILFAQTNREHAEELMGVIVGVPVTSVSLTPSNVTLEIGGTKLLTATILPENATAKSLTYTSSNPSVATVDLNGRVTAVSEGTAIITATTLSEAKTATCIVTVNKPVVTTIPVISVSLSQTSAILTKGNTLTLVATINPTDATNKSILFTSSNSSVAIVDGSGKVTAISAGETLITATSIGEGKTATCSVKVLQPVESVSLPLQNLSIEVGTTYSLTGTVNPSSATNTSLLYTSSNPSVATIDGNGKVTALAVGTTTITARSVDGGKTATCNVTVTQRTSTPVSTWTDVNPIAERTSGNTRVLKAYNNSTTLYLLVKGTNLKTKSQFYIDADNNYATGFKAVWSNSGVEYLIENQYLYKYSGTSNRWNWTEIGRVNIVKSGTSIGVSVPLAKLNLNINNVIHIGFMRADVRTDTLPIKTLPLAPYTIGNGTATMNLQ